MDALPTPGALTDESIPLLPPTPDTRPYSPSPERWSPLAYATHPDDSAANHDLETTLQRELDMEGQVDAMPQPRFLEQQQRSTQLSPAARQILTHGGPALPDSRPYQPNVDSQDNIRSNPGALDSADAVKQVGEETGRSGHASSGAQATFQSPSYSGSLHQRSSMSFSENPPSVSTTPWSVVQAQRRMQLQETHHVVVASFLNNRPAYFLPQLAEFMASNATALPTAMTGMPSPTYDPSNPRLQGILPGSSIGTFNFFGTNVDLYLLLMYVIQRNGYVKTQNDDKLWEMFLEYLGLPRLHQPPNANQPVDLVPILKNHTLFSSNPLSERG